MHLKTLYDPNQEQAQEDHQNHLKFHVVLKRNYFTIKSWTRSETSTNNQISFCKKKKLQKITIEWKKKKQWIREQEGSVMNFKWKKEKREVVPELIEEEDEERQRAGSCARVRDGGYASSTGNKNDQKQTLA